MKSQFSIVACSLRDIGWLLLVVITLSQILNFGLQLGFNQDQIRHQLTGSGLATHRENVAGKTWLGWAWPPSR